VPGIDVEFALALRAYLQRQHWPVDEITEILLVGRAGNDYSFQLVAAYPTTGEMVDSYIMGLYVALAAAIDSRV
jgi:hypothetical protein